MKKIFITGGAGFIASHIIERLITQNEIIVFDNFTRNALQFTDFNIHNNLTIIKGDVLNSTLLKNTINGCDIVIHCAAVAGIKSVGRNVNTTIKTNLIGTYNTLEASVKNNVKLFIDFSTSEIYGPSVYKAPEHGFTTLGMVGQRRWAYAVSKIAGEHLAHSYHEAFGLNVVTVRPFNIYGPRQVGEGAIEQMTIRALKNEPITIFNDGTQIRAWCYVDDFVNAIIEILKNKFTSEVFNIGNPQSTVTVLDLAERIIELTKSKSKIIFKPHPEVDVDIRVPDISKAIKLLCYQPKIHLNVGLKNTIEWYRNNLSLL